MIGNRKSDRQCQALIPVIINGRQCASLADAGASVTLLHSDISQELGLKLNASSLRASGVTNDSLNILGEAVVNIRIGKDVLRHRLYIVSNISHEMILGIDFLRKLGEVTYNFSDCTFKFNDSILPMDVPCRTNAVTVNQTVKIPPLSEVAVVAHISTDRLHQRQCLFEGMNCHVPKSLLIGKCLDRVCRNTIRVPVMNTSNEMQEIRINSVIGEIETIDESDALMTTKAANPKASQNKVRPGDRAKLDDSMLNIKEKQQLKSLLNEFEDIIGENISELGRTKIVQHVIETLPGVSPIRSKPYNIPIGLRAEVKAQLDEMQKQGLITIGTGEWSSPIVLVKKKDNTWRFCVDYRKLNAVTVKHSMALSSIDNVAEIMHGKKYFSTIDLCSGFFQVTLHESSQEKSGFITPWGPYKWKVMPQGASGSPSTFARLSLAIMADLISEGSSAVYLDDWIMTSKDFPSHLTLLRTVFSRLRFAGLKYRLSKSFFCQREVLYLGHLISQDGMSVAPHNVKKIVDFPNPKDKTGVRRLLGLFGFYRSFIKGFSKIAAPLIKLTNKDTPFEWSDECEKVTNELKARITTAPILTFPDFSKQFILTTDASSIALGGVLSQIGDDGKDHPIAFYSKALNKAERKWDSCELELYAILSCVKHFRHYLLNTKFRIRTDNKACTYVLKKAELSPRLARWAIQLADYDYDIEHTPGRHNCVADALSRAELVAAVDTDQPDPVDAEMSLAQSKDYYLGPIKLFLEKNKFPIDMSKRNQNQVRKDSESFRLINDVLYREQNSKLLLAIPSSQRKSLLYAAHESLMSLHPGVTKTLLKLRDQYWFPHMTKHVTDHIAQCGSCQRRKNPKNPQRVPLKNQMASGPFHVLSVDFQGPFVESESGMKHILVFTDHFTKWCEMIPTKDQTANTVAQCYIDTIFCRYGCSEILISDRAKNFLSDVVKQVNKLLQVDHRLTSPYHPQTNGQVEVYNRSIANMLSHVVAEHHRDWDKYVSFCQLAHNSSRHTIINASPSMLLMGREVRLPFDLTKPQVQEEVEEGTFAASLHDKMRKVWSLARQYISKGKIKQKKYYDRHTNPTKLKVGDAVLYYNRRGYRNRTSKLIKRWTGIYIIKWISDTNADIQSFDDPDFQPIRVHLNNLKLYRGPLVRGDSSEFDIDLDPPSGDESDVDNDPVGAQSRYEPTESDFSDSDNSASPSVPDRPASSRSIAGSTRADAAVRPNIPSSRGSPVSAPSVDSDRHSASSMAPRVDGRYTLRQRPKKKRDAAFVYSS